MPNGKPGAWGSIIMSRSRVIFTRCPTAMRASRLKRLTARTVEIFIRGDRIAVHMRGSGNGRHTTLPEHMPSSHRRFADWTLAKILTESGGVGPCAQLLCEKILEDRPHPEQGFRSCMRSEEHTSELQSLMRISSAVF